MLITFIIGRARKGLRVTCEEEGWLIGLRFAGFFLGGLRLCVVRGLAAPASDIDTPGTLGPETQVSVDVQPPLVTRNKILHFFH